MRLSKKAMVEMAQRRHPDAAIVDAYKMAGATLSYRTPQDGLAYIAFYNTDILTLDHEGRRIIVDVGPRATLTTLRRLNAYATFAFGVVFQGLDPIVVMTPFGSARFTRRAWVYRDKAPVGDMR